MFSVITVSGSSPTILEIHPNVLSFSICSFSRKFQTDHSFLAANPYLHFQNRPRATVSFYYSSQLSITFLIETPPVWTPILKPRPSRPYRDPVRHRAGPPWICEPPGPRGVFVWARANSVGVTTGHPRPPPRTSTLERDDNNGHIMYTRVGSSAHCAAASGDNAAPKGQSCLPRSRRRTFAGTHTRINTDSTCRTPNVSYKRSRRAAANANNGVYFRPIKASHRGVVYLLSIIKVLILTPLLYSSPVSVSFHPCFLFFASSKPLPNPPPLLSPAFSLPAP